MKVRMMIMFCLLAVFLASGCARPPIEAGANKEMISSETLDHPQKSPVTLTEEEDYIPKHAFMDPESQVSVRHPIEIKKAGAQKISLLKFPLNYGLLILEDIIGEWPILAHLPDGREVKGYVRFDILQDDLQFWAEAVFLVSEKELEDAKVLMSSRDGGFFYDFEGREFVCDLKKFDEDMSYRQKFFADYGSKISRKTEEIEVGSQAWESWIGAVNNRLKSGILFDYKMANEEIRVSELPIELFRLASTRSNDWSFGERAFKRAGKIPLTLAAFTEIGIPLVVASNLIAGAIDEVREGSYARANGPRHQIVPTALKMQSMVREKVAYMMSMRRYGLN